MHSRKEYKYGFVTDLESEVFPKGINENIVRMISEKKNEPKFMLDFRLNAYHKWKSTKPPLWGNFRRNTVLDFQDLSYYCEFKEKPQLDSLEQVDPKILETMDKLGISLDEQKRLNNVSMEVVFDSLSLGNLFKDRLKKAGVVLCSIGEAVEKYPEIVKKYLGSVVPVGDNFYATLNSAVFSDGSFVYLPKGVRAPLELGTYFRINQRNNGQFERTLIVAEEDSYVSYLEGCTAPAFPEEQLHAAVVEIVIKDRAEVKYSTVQNWYGGDSKGKGGVYNFVTKRGLCKGKGSKLSWVQVEAGSALTWKYPSSILEGDNSSASFFSVALTNGYMEADTGTKMIHKGNNTSSTIVSKGISADNSHNSYRGKVVVHKDAENCRNYTQCDSMLVGNNCTANTFPQIDVANSSAKLEHEASTSKLGMEEIFYIRSRGIPFDNAVHLLVNGFCEEVINSLPMEFAEEAKRLLSIKLEGSVG